MSGGSIEIQVVGAIRIALEGAANDEAALSLVKWLVDQAPQTLASDTDSVRLLLDGIRACGYSISTESPSGMYATARQAISEAHFGPPEERGGSA